MPTVLRVGGFSFKIIPADHDPPHVHVRYSGASVVISIESEEFRKARGMSEVDIARAIELVRMHRDELLAAWIEWKAAEVDP
jgi:hypothetical protein